MSEKNASQTISALNAQLKKTQFAFASLEEDHRRLSGEKAFAMAELKMEQASHQQTLEEAGDLIKRVQELEKQVEELTAPAASTAEEEEKEAATV